MKTNPEITPSGEEDVKIPFGPKRRNPRSKPKTSLEVLRRTISEVVELESLLGQSRRWMDKVSAGKIPLPPGMATLIELETGISSNWLCGKPTKPPVDESGQPYTIESFRRWRDTIRAGEWPKRKAIKISAFLPELIAVGTAAGQEGKASLFFYRLELFIRQAVNEFGVLRNAGRRVAAALANSPRFEGIAIHDENFDWKPLIASVGDVFTTVTQSINRSCPVFEMSRLERLRKE